MSNVCQSLTVLLSAILLHSDVVRNANISRWFVIIAMSAGSGLQVAMAKTLQCPEVPTAMRECFRMPGVLPVADLAYTSHKPVCGSSH